MSEGIVFFADFALPCGLLTVALHTLEDRYDGDICVMCGQHAPSSFRDELGRHARIRCIEWHVDYARLAPYARHPSHRCWCVKPWVHEASPFDTTILYDCDHVFTHRFDLRAFELIREAGLLSFHHELSTYSSMLKKRMRSRVVRVRELMECTVDILPPTNGGCSGSSRIAHSCIAIPPEKRSGCRDGEELIRQWKVATAAFGSCRHKDLRHIPDEFGLSHTLATNNIAMGPPRWSYTVQEPNQKIPSDTIAAHFVLGRYESSDLFATAFRNAVEANYMHLADHCAEYVSHNPRLARAAMAMGYPT